ncbi:MAG: PAS domain S-box-containing protein [Crocinitomicaceae bacterium]
MYFKRENESQLSTLKSKLLLLVFLLSGIQLNAQLYTFQNYSHRDGLNMGAITCIEQSSDGYLWIGTDGAELVRFNGKEFEEMTFAGGEDNNHHYRNLSFDGDNILFSSQYKGFYSYSRSTKKITSLLSKKYNIGDRLHVVKKGSVYYFIGALGIVCKINGEEKLIRRFPTTKPLQLYEVIDVGHKIVITTNHGVDCLGDEALIGLNKWLNLSIHEINEFRFGWYESDKLTLINKVGDRRLEIILNERGTLFSLKESNLTRVIAKNDSIISLSYNPVSHSNVAVSAKGSLYKLTGDLLVRIVHNYPEPIRSALSVLADMNGDFWLSSDLKGIYKVSEEPFTRIQLHPLYASEDISFPFKTSDQRIFLSTFEGKTHVGEIDENTSFETFDFQIFGAAEMDGIYYFGTDRGIKSYNPDGPLSFKTTIAGDESISFILADGRDLWFGIRGKGLHRYNFDTKRIRVFRDSYPNSPDYIYTGQVSQDDTRMYFGSNDGVIYYDKSTKKIEAVPYSSKLFGSYSGVSTKDIFGNLWFTLEKGLLAITPNEVKTIKGKHHFETNLFYTLNADVHGNLIVGTNKGITILKVDPDAKIVNSQTYTSESGFMGYETHMRSQFQDDNRIFIGTVEGLFLINSDIIENLNRPLAPVIIDLSREGLEDSQTSNLNAFQFKFQVNNPKIGGIKYRYRIRERDNNWSYLEETDLIRIADLESGTYTLEVCSSYDGIAFSEPTLHLFEVQLPIWKSKWFVMALIALIILINIFLLIYSRRFDTSQLLSTKDTELHIRMTPATLMFGTVLVPASQISGSFLSDDLPMNIAASLLVGFALLSLYFVALTVKKSGQIHVNKYLLVFAIYMITFQFFWSLISSNLHPFHVIGIALITSIAPYILNRVLSTIIYGMVVLLLSIACILLVGSDPLYPKSLFMVAILASVVLTVFNSYLRHNSIEKLIFVSGIINRGNFPVIAFRADGIVTYVSENINNFINIDHDTLLNNKISLLNQFALFDENYHDRDVTSEFSEGDKYLIPMVNADEGVRWMEWSYKRFSENTRVIIGHDVSERIELQNTYELLVENVEDLIYTLDLNGNFVFVNQAFIAKMGYSKEDVAGTQSLNIVIDRYHNEVAEFYKDHFNQRKSTTYKEFPIRKKNGEIIWVGQHVNTIYAPGSKVYIKGFIALARDITDVRAQQQVIMSQRDDITSSINYARKIQVNLLPRDRQFLANFEDYFLMYRPKDIVSGDFYWMQKIDGRQVIALADCTGHGVPGAFMTLFGINMLNSIVLEARLTEPGMILNELDKRLAEYFQKETSKERINDGMELTICVIDEKQEEISYACAGSRFLIHSDGGFTMFKGNNEHIGDHKGDGFKGYYSQYTRLKASDTLYLFTDGFQDQVGGINRKTYSFRRLLELFESNANLSLLEQRKMIESEFDSWKGKETQTDDVTVISIKRNK